MTYDKIESLRERLNKALVSSNASYDEILGLSREMDLLILEHYSATFLQDTAFGEKAFEKEKSL